MIVGIPKEIKKLEKRVAITPGGVEKLVSHKHTVIIEKGAGLGSGFTDDQYKATGAKMVSTAKEVFSKADMIYKVKEPLAQEIGLFKKGQILFTYLHLAADRKLTEALLKTGIIGFAYETYRGADGSLPLLSPMSEIAGKLSIQAGAYALEAKNGGKGILLGGVAGVPPAKVLVLGAGIAGIAAATVAAGMGADVTIADINTAKLRNVLDIFGSKVKTLYSDNLSICELVKTIDLVIGSVLIPGAKAPKLITNKMLKTMQKGTVLVDISIDQGGCFEHSRPTTHDQPIYDVDGKVFYCVANMPGAVPRSSTYALTNVTISPAVKLADIGWERSIKEDAGLRTALNVLKGQLTEPKVAETFKIKYAEQKI